MVRIHQRLQTPAPAEAVLILSFDQRQKSRQRARLESGEEVGLNLPHGTVLRGGDRLRADDGRVIEVRAAPEPVSTAASLDPIQLTRAAYHLGKWPQRSNWSRWARRQASAFCCGLRTSSRRR